MRNYWNCTKFADKIRGTTKPEYASSEVWREWEEKAKTAHPFRFWLVEEGFDKVQTLVYYPFDKLYDLKYYIINRFVTKTHTLTSKLKKGEYHELDTRILHCLFDELVNFVEIEKAWMNVVWQDENRKKYKYPGWAVGPFRTRTWRCPEAGVDYLLWEISDPSCAGRQAESAQTVLDLYNWWTIERPKRPDIYETTGWSVYCESKHGDYLSYNDDGEEQNVSKMIEENYRLEDEYNKEDEEMLIKLIKVRLSLWT